MTDLLRFDGLVFQAVRIECRDHILTVTLNRPHRKNAINDIMANEIIYALDVAASDPDVRVVVLAAAGEVFCSGGDLSVMGGGGEEVTSTVPKRGELYEISMRLRSVRKPVVVKAQGPVLAGALMFVCNATHVVAADHVTFSAPEIKRGLWPFMVMAGLFRVMPRRQALDFIMRGYKIDAVRARDLGLVNEVVPAVQLDGAVAALAADLASLSPATIRMGLEALYAQEAMEFDTAIPYLMSMLAKTMQTEDAQEGIAAFFQKREPVWKGR